MSEAYETLLFFYRRWFKKTKKAEIPEDVTNLFIKYLQPNDCSNEGAVIPPCPTPISGDYTRGIMPIKKLHEFLKEQGMEVEEAEKAAQSMISSRNLKGIFNYQRNGLSLNGFFQQCLLSRHLNDPLVKKEFEDEAPLGHYFVYTSHTSYLRKREIIPEAISQGIKSKLSNNTIMQKFTGIENEYEPKREKIVYCDIEAITKALKSGVRVITLDLQEPKQGITDFEVQHPKYINVNGDQIYFSKGGKYYRFRKTNPALMLKMCLKAIKKNAFVTSEYPLIIVLVKHFDGSESLLQQLIRRVFKRNEDLCHPDTALKSSLRNLKKKFIIMIQGTSTLHENVIQEGAEGNIAGYMEKFRGDSQNLGRSSGPDKPVNVSMTVDDLEKMKSGDILRFTRENENLLAVYPNVEDPGIDSNYDPSIGWTRGAQMVALNMQERDKGLWIMQGLCRAQDKNDKITGYVKKPDILLNPQFDPTVWRPVKKILKVKVYLGTGWHLDFDRKDFDPSSPPDFFAAVEIVGVPADEAREKTVPVMDQWIPMWNQEFEFPLTVPELAMLVIEVKEFDPDRTHDFGGQSCLPVSQLKTGFRSVPLYNQKGKSLRSAKVLMYFHLD